MFNTRTGRRPGRVLKLPFCLQHCFFLLENTLTLHEEKILHMKTIINLSILFVAMGCLSLGAQTPEYGNAAYYADYFHGKKTASGENYSKYEFTCAHKHHPFGTQLKVTRMDNMKSVTVRVNDRGPYTPGFVVDLSWAAADQIGLLLDGKAEVKVEVAGFSSGMATPAQQQVPTAYSAPSSQMQARAVEQPAKAPEQSFKLPLPPKPVTFNSAFPEETNYQAAKTPERSATPAAYSDVPTSYSAASAPIRTSAGSYAIQVGSYTNKANAERQAKMIRDKGVKDVSIKESRNSAGAPLYRILVGPYADRDQASKQSGTLKSKYELSGFVVNMANL
jgi:rare lipoprotein A